VTEKPKPVEPVTVVATPVAIARPVLMIQILVNPVIPLRTPLPAAEADDFPVMMRTRTTSRL
jgi:hypothetical protein